MYPALRIDSQGLIANLHAVQHMCEERGIALSVVTKGLIGYERLGKLLIDNGATSICESHIQNFDHLEGKTIEKWLIRGPMLSQVEQVVRLADVSLNTEIEVVRALSAAAVKQGRRHKVVVMVELGETREGVLPADMPDFCREVASLPGVELHGIGTNLTCYAEIVPDEANQNALAEVVASVEEAVGFTLPVVSGGNSTSLWDVQAGTIHPAINHLRSGEGILTGNIPGYEVPFEGAATMNFVLEAEIIELKDKPSKPWGSRPPGHVPILEDAEFPDDGTRLRALVALGKQDTNLDHIAPLDPSVRMLGGCSDVLVVDLTDADREYRVGDVIAFKPDYYATFPAINSRYVEKIIL